MTKKLELFQLIKSLSKAEKRYFKLSFSRSESALNYLQLFDAIDAQLIYDETAIRKKFKKEAFCKQLHVTKNYLRNLILKTLRNFHSKISKDAELKDLLRNVEILYHRELYSLCEAELRRAEVIARSFEINTALAEIIGWKRKLQQVLNTHKFDQLMEMLHEQEQAIDAMYDTNLHWQHAVAVSRTAMSGYSDKPLKSSKKATLENAQTLEAKVLFHNATYLSCLRNGYHDKAEKSLIDLLELLQRHPHRMHEDPALYVSSANNLISYFVFSKQYGKALELINQTRAFYENGMQQYEKRSLLKQILRTYNIELEIYRDKKVHSNSHAFIEHVESFITRHVTKIPADYLISFWYQLACVRFMLKDFDQSLKWINYLLNAQWRDVRIDLQVHSRMLNLIIHLEQYNLFVLRYFVDSTRRFLKKARAIQPFEECLLAFFSKIGQVPKFEHNDKFRELEHQLFLSGNTQVPAEALDYIDYKSWVEGKLSNNF